MCTAINSIGNYHLFGRTLDLECSYGEKLTVLPRNSRLDFLHGRPFISHLSVIGISHIGAGAALYYDAINEAGLAMAALNFPNDAVYSNDIRHNKDNVASFELISWVLCQCESVEDAEKLLKKINITAERFSEELPATPLHWIVADKKRAITVEQTREGLKIYSNPWGIMTNSPAFSYHITRIADFLGVDSKTPENNLCPDKKIEIYSRGLGAYGLPGDFSSASRFIRGVFLNGHTDHSDSEIGEVGRFFHIMSNLSVPCGSVKASDGRSVMTVYTSCACSNSMTYYFSTYGCRRIKAVAMKDFDLDGDRIESLDIFGEEDVLWIGTKGRK